jgi:S-phase kinase-associated protein 1
MVLDESKEQQQQQQQQPDTAEEQEDLGSVSLVSQEGDSFDVRVRVASQSELVRAMIDEDQDADENQEVPLPNCTTAVLAKVLEFCEHHDGAPFRGIPKPLASADMREVVPEWDAAFVDIEQELLFELILAANYLDIKSLLDLTCAKVASMIKGRSPEEIRKTFSIVNDFTAEEEAQVREENKWCEEA